MFQRRPVASVLLLAALAIALTLLIAMSLDAELGDVGEWVSGVGTAGALAVSLYLLWHEQAIRREQQARLITYEVGVKTFDSDDYSLADPPDGPCLYVTNNSDEAVFDLTVQPEPYDPDGEAPGALFGTIPPHTTREAFWPFWPDRPSPARPTINFVDARGIAWHRDRFRLTLLSDKPEAIKDLDIDLVSPPQPMHRPPDDGDAPGGAPDPG